MKQWYVMYVFIYSYGGRDQPLLFTEAIFKFILVDENHYIFFVAISSSNAGCSEYSETRTTKVHVSSNIVPLYND